jgi:hypothetical protein
MAVGNTVVYGSWEHCCIWLLGTLLYMAVGNTVVYGYMAVGNTCIAVTYATETDYPFQTKKERCVRTQ